MALTRIGARLAGAALLFLAPLAAHAAPGDPVIGFDKPVYQTGDAATFTLTGTPGHALWLLFEKAPGPTTIPGLGTFGLLMGAGLDAYPIGLVPPSGTFVASCAPDCGSAAADGPTFVQAVTIDPQTGSLAISNTAVFQVQRGDECHNCPKTPTQDPIYGVTSAGTAVYLHGIGNDFVFAPGASFAEYNTGTARLTGEIYRPSVPTERFLLDASFVGFSGPGDIAGPPAGSPKLELAAGAYSDQGGPINPATWHYYGTFTGLLIGLDDFAGGTLTFGRMGPAFQVGQGANGKDLSYGGSGWLSVGVLTQPTTTTWAATGGGDINIQIGDCPPLGQPLCVTAAAPDSQSPQQQLAPHALVNFGYDGKFLFTGNGGEFTEFPDGTARLKGELVQAVDITKKWDIDVLFTNKVDVGDPQNPPAGSPKLELMPTAYIWNGGPIDPATWHYYQDFTGTMTGKDSYAGASLLVTRRGPAFQVGDGASGKNVTYGGSAWTFFDVITQPTSGPALPLSADGDINVNFVLCPTP